MYKKYLIVSSKKDLAGMNITSQLQQFGEFNIYLVDEEIIYTENLDLNKINQFDFIIFASRHVSEKKEKSLSVHAPGNWRKADFGGEDKKICKTSAIFQKHLFERLFDNAKQFHIEEKYQITLECTHHGPLIEKPCVFIEIGATETEWNDRVAGFVVAKTISELIKDFKGNPYHEIAIGIGGPHYCPNFNKIQNGTNVAISHIIPQYSLPITEEMIKEAVEKTEEEIDFILLDWKGIGNADERQRILDILEKNYLRHKKTSDVE